MRTRLIAIAVALVLVLIAVGLFVVPRGTERAPSPPAAPEERTEPAPPADTAPIPEPAPEKPAAEEPAAEGPGAPAPDFPVSGRVIERGGGPLEGASVSIAGGTWANTGADGVFTVGAKSEGEAELTVRHPRYRNTKLRVTVPAADVVVMLDRGLSVTGRVAFPDGRPVPGVGLQGPDFEQADTDEEGRYELSGLADGPTRVQCIPAGETREVPAGSTGVDFTVKKHLLRITLVDEEGEAVRGADYFVKATVGNEEVMTMVGSAADGSFDCRAPSGAVVFVAPSAPGFAKQVTRIELDDRPRLHERRIVVPREVPQGRVALRVVRDSGEVPEKVYLEFRNEAAFYSVREVTPDAEGRATVDAQAGTFTLSVGTRERFTPFAEDAGLPAEREITIEPGRTVPVEVTIETGGWLRVTVRDAAGRVTTPRWLSLLAESGERLSGGFAGKTGEGWTLPPSEPGPASFHRPLPPGNYTVTLARERGAEPILRREVAIVRGRTTDVEFRLPD